MKYLDLVNKYPIMSLQINRASLSLVLRELETVLEQGIAGDIAEFGCYSGTTSLFIRRVLDARQEIGRTFYAYDSFAGLPEKTSADSSTLGTQFKAGELAVSKKEFLRNFQKAGLRPPITHKAWFSDLQSGQLPATLAYAFLDSDFYQSILDSLELVWPRLSRGGVITIDDYQRLELPGVTQAVTEFCRGKAVKLHFEYHTGIMRKL